MRRELLVRTICCALVVLVWSAMVLSAPAQAEQMLVFGPKTYVKEQGKPNTYTESFVVPRGVTNLKLVVTNGAGDTDEVKNIYISVNGTEVVSKNDLKPTGSADKMITYRANGANTLTAKLLGPEGHSVVVSLYGDKPAEPAPAPSEPPVVRR